MLELLKAIIKVLASGLRLCSNHLTCLTGLILGMRKHTSCLCLPAQEMQQSVLGGICGQGVRIVCQRFDAMLALSCRQYATKIASREVLVLDQLFLVRGASLLADRLRLPKALSKASRSLRGPLQPGRR